MNIFALKQYTPVIDSRYSVSVRTTVRGSSISFEGQDASNSETGSPWWGHDEVKIDSEEWSPALYCVD